MNIWGNLAAAFGIIILALLATLLLAMPAKDPMLGDYPEADSHYEHHVKNLMRSSEHLRGR